MKLLIIPCDCVQKKKFSFQALRMFFHSKRNSLIRISTKQSHTDSDIDHNSCSLLYILLLYLYSIILLAIYTYLNVCFASISHSSEVSHSFTRAMSLQIKYMKNFVSFRFAFSHIWSAWCHQRIQFCSFYRCRWSSSEKCSWSGTKRKRRGRFTPVSWWTLNQVWIDFTVFEWLKYKNIACQLEYRHKQNKNCNMHSWNTYS